MASEGEEIQALNMVYPPSASSRSSSSTRQSPIAIDDVESSPDSLVPIKSTVSGSRTPQSIEAAVKVEENVVAKETKAKPPSSVTAPGKPVSTTTGAKPKSTRPTLPRSPSPAPPALPIRPPLQTIRLDIPLGGPEDYEVDIASLSNVAGQRPPTPVIVLKGDISDDSHSEGDDEGDGKSEKRKRRKRKNLSSEYYDTTDPFIDDSELAQDERKFFAQTKQKGFYVSSGQVALLNKTPTKKPKSKKLNILAPAASVTAALSSGPLPPSLAGPLSIPSQPSTSKVSSPKKKEHGTREEPIALLSDTEEERSGSKRKLVAEISSFTNTLSTPSEGSSKKRRKTVEIQPFHPELEEMFVAMKAAIAKENWEVKGKFPPSLKPMLAQISLKAVILGEYDDNFFNIMPRLFPYNKFTMTKLIKRTIWREHTNLLMERQNTLLKELKVLADEGFPKAKEEWEKNVRQWEKRQERAKLAAETETGGAEGSPSAAPSVEGTPVASDSQPTPRMSVSALAQRGSVDEAGDETGLEHEDGPGGRGKDSHAPGKKYRLTDTMKAIIWQLVCLSNECCRIENEKNALEGSNQVVSDQGVRKTLYQRIVNAFPEGWLSSGQISREVSVMKKKYEKEVMENEA
ncbi:uncharacterized protein LAESUDRAFT_732100 [Laetiporus sulphureus 93-53]|uniref:Ubinuclein middle domain-containing protein n=1 Tax=Laetiporus sulphureus 93-53 TaxID=1314785 RepID=A0A165BA91_9APHY|nr:uncharacterized protein LAESUDRAFT_732100 [Laetiporus sulphureus 93-53]KZT00606.1 hypothetical protein LAESUDRAFT_732100 [Laetiporus sulphureus 93-53]